jgi:hypothetical protein
MNSGESSSATADSESDASASSVLAISGCSFDLADFDGKDSHDLVSLQRSARATGGGSPIREVLDFEGHSISNNLPTTPNEYSQRDEARFGCSAVLDSHVGNG